VLKVRPLFLVGFMGAGKTTVGRILADSLGRRFVDLDRAIEESTGRSVDQLFEEVGEEGFRDAERDALTVAALDAGSVVACGGGIVTDDASREALANAGDVAYLEVSAGEALARVGGRFGGRPLLQGADPAGAAALLGLRERLYEEVADFTVDTVGRTPAEVAERIAAWVVLEP
jgi:shikimate kinase